MEPIEISICNDFSETPGPRNRDEGDFSGQAFREEVLRPKFEQALSEKRKIRVNLDGTMGYGTSFLEEVFGGLAREFPQTNLNDLIEIVSTEEDYLVDDIKDYIQNARKQNE